MSQSKPKFRVVAISENGGHHIAYSKAAKVWLDKLASENSFAIDYIHSADAPELFENKAYTTLFRNAIFWAASKK